MLTRVGIGMVGAFGVAAAAAVLPGCIFVSKSERSGRVYASNELATRVTPGQELPGVRERRKDDMAKLTPGMSLEEFRKSFPDAIFVESREGARQWHAYSVTHEELCQMNDAAPFTHKSELWFFFQDNQYRGFGKPRTWPADAQMEDAVVKP